MVLANIVTAIMMGMAAHEAWIRRVLCLVLTRGPVLGDACVGAGVVTGTAVVVVVVVDAIILSCSNRSCSLYPM